MTNTLHRFGSAASFDDDFIVFAMACKGPFKQENALEGLRRFLQIAIEYGPVNLGDARHGGAIRPSRQMNPFAHWSRDNRPDFQAVVDGLTDVTTCAAVFDDRGISMPLRRWSMAPRAWRVMVAWGRKRLSAPPLKTPVA